MTKSKNNYKIDTIADRWMVPTAYIIFIIIPFSFRQLLASQNYQMMGLFILCVLFAHLIVIGFETLIRKIPLSIIIENGPRFTPFELLARNELFFGICYFVLSVLMHFQILISPQMKWSVRRGLIFLTIVSVASFYYRWSSLEWKDKHEEK